MSTVPTAKVLLLGDASVGKTSLRSQFIHHRFSSAYRSTVGGDFLTAKVYTSASFSGNPPRSIPDRYKHDESDDPSDTTSQYHGEPEAVSLQIWDTAGQERFDSLVRSFYRGTDVAILVYDVTNASSFSHLAKWIRDFAAHAQVRGPVIIVVGNKIDKAEYRTVSARQAREFADAAAAANNLHPPPPQYRFASNPIAFPDVPGAKSRAQTAAAATASNEQSYSTALSLGSETAAAGTLLHHGSSSISSTATGTMLHPSLASPKSLSSVHSSPQLPPTSSSSQQQQQQQEPAIRCFEVSAKDNIDVDRLFTYVADRIVAARRDVIFNFDSVDMSDGMVDIGGDDSRAQNRSFCC